MPRTKISKSSKRNREEHNSRELKIREFNECLEKSLNDMERYCIEEISLIESEFQMILNRTNSSLLKMKMVDFLKLDLDKFNVWDSECPVILQSKYREKSNDNNNSAISNGLNSKLNCTSGSILRRGKVINDEGYLTEDSGSGTQVSLLEINNQMPQPQTLPYGGGRTPGPLSSARARRLRRSRSACDSDRVHNLTKPVLNNNNMHRSSRSKLRTPTVASRYAVSVDRMNGIDTKGSCNRNIQHSPPAAFMRWPKPGEMVVSTCGSPIVAQAMPDRIANVNIPIKNGILSLRPKKLYELKTDIINSIDHDTLHQIRTLNANLDLIVALADKANSLK